MLKFVKRQFEVVLKICASPSAVDPSLIFCRPRALFFVAPRRQPRGSLPGDAVPNDVRGDAVPNEVKDASACARQDGGGNFFETASEAIKAPSGNLFNTFHCRGARLGAQ
jgi:hypothetical protein